MSRACVNESRLSFIYRKYPTDTKKEGKTTPLLIKYMLFGVVGGSIEIYEWNTFICEHLHKTLENKQWDIYVKATTIVCRYR